MLVMWWKKKKKYQYKVLTQDDYRITGLINKAQEEGWEVCGDIHLYQGNWSSGKTTLASIPVRKELTQ